MPKQNPSPKVVRESLDKRRGQPLSLYLIFTGLLLSIAICSSLWFAVQLAFARPDLTVLPFFRLIEAALYLAILFFSAGAWFLRKWAYFGLVIAYAFTSVFMLYTADIIAFIVLAIGLIMFLAFSSKKYNQFE